MAGEANKLLELARRGALLAPGRAVVVMLSGGRDSVCLLDLAVRISGRDAVAALHVNYGLRDAAGDEESLCRELCDRVGAFVHVERARPPRNGNLQAWAREVRYAPAHALAGEREADVAAGHTATDQAETVLYRLAASPGRRALLGMAAREGRVIRPLLEATRDQTAAYCVERGLAWSEDDSNASPSYARARVRHGLVPALRAVHPAAERNVVRTARELRDEEEVLAALVSQTLDGRDEIELARLGALPPALARLVVRHLAERAARRPVPSAAQRLDELLSLAARGGSAELHLEGVRALVEYGVVRFTAETSAPGPAATTLAVPGATRFGAWELRCEHAPVRPSEGVLDAARLASQLVVRRWREGDRMAPLGSGGTKSLQDLFTDRRVPRSRRQTLPLVESAGEIAWIPGVATSERFRVTDRTEQAVRLTARTAA